MDENRPRDYKQKVFINPNFNRNKSSKISHNCHVNPAFSQQFARNENNKKIYINPNFLQPTIQACPDNDRLNIENTINNLNTNYSLPNTSSMHITTAPIVNSKYCLVRNVHNKETNDHIKLPEKNTSTTIKIGKYKSMTLSVLRKNTVEKNTISIPSTSLSKNKYKMVKQSPVKITQTTPKKFILSKNRKILAKSMKKNNIPCPLFKKYGKCIRNSNGRCDYLHDKKHVSMCRKYLKGACHDPDCLFSHESSSNKLPTCLFYLKGMCTKESCPYLHVKLNDKAKICSDFIKGFCSNGDKCLKLHSNVKKKNTSIKNNDRVVYIKKYSKKQPKKQHKTDETVTSKEACVTENVVEQSRYYIETVSEECKTIKPSREKLGDLPSFIGL